MPSSSHLARCGSATLAVKPVQHFEHAEDRNDRTDNHLSEMQDGNSIESLAAPLIEATRQQYEKTISEKDQEIAQREEAVRSKEKQILEDARHLETQVADQVAEQLKTERRCQ